MIKEFYDDDFPLWLNIVARMESKSLDLLDWVGKSKDLDSIRESRMVQSKFRLHEFVS